MSIRSNDGSTFRISSAVVRSGPITGDARFSKEVGVETHLEICLVAPERSGVHRGEVQICIEGETQSQLTLPVSLMVQANERGGASP